MREKRLLSLAIMNVHDSNNIDQFDQFVPFVKEALLRSSVDTVSANDLKNHIYDYFRIELPISVVDTILKRKLLPKGYVLNKKDILVSNYEKLKNSNFQEVKQSMMKKHETLIEDIMSYSMEKYETELEMESTEKALELFLEKHQLTLLESSLKYEKTSDVSLDIKKDEKIEYIISDFIRHAQDAYLVSFEYLIDIVKGTMLTNALYYNEDSSTLNMKFSGTEIYFDSSFLIYALGYAGQARQEPCIELIDVLLDNNAILKVFKHNIDEMIGILEFCKTNLTTREINDTHGTIHNFLDKGYSELDIDKIIYRLEDNLKEKFKINVSETVDYDDHSFVISHEELDNKLKNRMLYRSELARDRDVQSVSAIMRLRRGLEPQHIEKSRALFVTNNFTFAHTIKESFLDEEAPKKVPAVLHDSILTNLMWLKSPSKAPDLPRKRLIAETYAATHPSEHLWKRYIETVNVYERNKEISKEDVVFLLYSQAAREMIMDITLGDAEIITTGTINEILTTKKNREEAKLKEVSLISEKEIERLEKEIRTSEEQAAATQETQDNNIMEFAKRRATIITNVIFIAILLAIGSVIYLSYSDFFNNTHLIIKTVIIIVFLITPTILGLLNINLIPWKNSVRNRLKCYYAENIKRKYYSNSKK